MNEVALAIALNILRAGGQIIHRHVGMGSTVELLDNEGVLIGTATEARGQLLATQTINVVDTDRSSGYSQTYALAQ